MADSPINHILFVELPGKISQIVRKRSHNIPWDGELKKKNCTCITILSFCSELRGKREGKKKGCEKAVTDKICVIQFEIETPLLEASAMNGWTGNSITVNLKHVNYKIWICWQNMGCFTMIVSNIFITYWSFHAYVCKSSNLDGNSYCEVDPKNAR